MRVKVLFMSLSPSLCDVTLKGFSGCGVRLGGVGTSSTGCRFALSGRFFMSLSKPRMRGKGLTMRLGIGGASNIFLLSFRARNFIVMPYSHYLSRVRLPISASSGLGMGLNSSFTRRNSVIMMPRRSKCVGVT